MNFKIAVKALIQNDQKKFLILKKTSKENFNDASNNLFDLPGGRLEYGEKLENALKREIKEETNLSIVNNILLHVDTVIRPDNTQLIIITYLCNTLGNAVILSEEHEDYFFLSKKEIIESSLYPKWIKDIIKLIK